MESTQEKFERVQLFTKKVVGITTQLTRFQATNYGIIKNLWQQFNRALHFIKGRNNKDPNWVKYGITQKKDQQLFYMAAIPYDEQFVLPEGMELFEIVAGKFVCFVHRGKLNNLQHTVTQIFKNDIPENRLQLLEGSELIFFERYDKRFHWSRDDSIIELYLPLVEQDRRKNEKI